MADLLDSLPITADGQRDKYIGLALAIGSSLAIGTSFIITKKGLIDAADRSDGFSSDSYSYLKNGIWWAGMVTMVVGEIANFAAYTFAPPILVTPLGALSVLIGAVLASFFLKEQLGRIGIAGCSLCLVGSIIIVLHAPEDKIIATVDEVLDYALQPGFVLYCLFVLSFSLYMIYYIAPTQGNSNPIVYISICSLVGSVSVMAVKGFGVALKLTFAGQNQLWRAGTWIFAFTVVGCIAVQMNYFNKALDLFPTTIVNPLYYVCFSTSTIIASTILFHGLNTTGGTNTISLLCGFYIISLGVYLLNVSRSDPTGIPVPNSSRLGRHSRSNSHSLLESGILGPRLSMSTRLSMESNTRDSFDQTRHSSRAEGTRRPSNGGLFRIGGATVGGVEPLFEFDEEGLPMDELEGEEEEDSEREIKIEEEERRGLVERERREREGVRSPGGILKSAMKSPALR